MIVDLGARFLEEVLDARHIDIKASDNELRSMSIHVLQFIVFQICRVSVGMTRTPSLEQEHKERHDKEIAGSL